MKRLVVVLAVIGLLTIGVWAECCCSQDTLDRNLIWGGVPVPEVPSDQETSDEVVVLANETYIVGYSNTRMNPLWVCYRLSSCCNGGARPDFQWRSDCRTSACVCSDDFTHTIYHRAHMAPKEAMFQCYGILGIYESFLLSNACPQFGEFNSGIWRRLEQIIREEYAGAGRSLWIITGPVFDDSNGCGLVGKDEGFSHWPQNPVEVPDQFYKIIVDLGDEPEILAFLLRHSRETTTQTNSRTTTQRLEEAIVSVDLIEEATHLDFFPCLDDLLESKIESICASGLW